MRKRWGVDKEQRVVPMDQHQHRVREDETEVGTRSKESCLLPQDGEVDGGRCGHSEDDLRSSPVLYVAAVVTLQDDTRELRDS